MNEKIKFTNIEVESLNLKSFLNTAIIMAFLNAFLYRFILPSNDSAVLAVVCMVVMMLIRIFLLKHGREYIVRRLFVGFLYLLLPLGWFISYGSMGPMVIHAFVFMLILSILAPTNELKILLPLMMLFEVLALWGFERKYASFLQEISKKYDVTKNMIENYAIAGVCISYFLIASQRNYNKVRNQLEDEFIHDDLTHAYNRKYCVLTMEQLIRENAKFVTIMMDIDNFKKVNDTFGHAAGDEVLCDLANAIVKSIRGEDVCSRIGGDEFMVILLHAEEGVQNLVINRILQHFAPTVTKYAKVNLGISFGHSPGHLMNVKEIMEQADQSMYSHKESKKLV